MGYYSALKEKRSRRKILSRTGKVAEVEQKEKLPFRKLTYRGAGLLEPAAARVPEQPSAATPRRRGGGTAGAASCRPAARGAREKPEVLKTRRAHQPSARDGGQRGWRPQRQDLQPGGNQA